MNEKEKNEREFWFGEAARDEAAEIGFANGCDCGSSEVNAFAQGALWGANRITPTLDQIEMTVAQFWATTDTPKDVAAAILQLIQKQTKVAVTKP